MLEIYDINGSLVAKEKVEVASADMKVIQDNPYDTTNWKIEICGYRFPFYAEIHILRRENRITVKY